MKLTGVLIPVRREQVECPDDGVHMATKDGFINSTHAVVCGFTLIPKGATALYVHKEHKGWKVFYGLDTGRKTNHSVVSKIADAMEDAGRLFCPRVHKIVGCDIDVVYRSDRIRTEALALEVEHVPWPETFENYLRGMPYLWDNYPSHNPKGFKRFVERARKAIGDQEYKLGNVLYNTRLDRWMLVDVRVE